MITWKFKCLKCGYKFSAIEPKVLFDNYNKCAMCGSKKIEKAVIPLEKAKRY